MTRGCAPGLLGVLALLSDVGAARWVLHKAGDLALAAAPGGYGVHEAFASEVIDAALAELAEAGLLTIEEAAFHDAGDGYEDDVDTGAAGPAASKTPVMPVTPVMKAPATRMTPAAVTGMARKPKTMTRKRITWMTRPSTR